MCPIHLTPFCCLISGSPLIYYRWVYLNGSVISIFILFSCPFTPWVYHLLQTDPWSDGLTRLLRSVHRLIDQPRVINVIRAHGVSSVVNFLERSIPSSSASFLLYKPASLPLILYFPQRIHNQSTTISFHIPAYRVLGAPVIYPSLVAIFNR